MIIVSQEEMLENMYGIGTDGICMVCGSRVGRVQPDAKNDPCTTCGSLAVFGLEEAMVTGLVSVE